MTRRTGILLAIMAGLLCLTALWSYRHAGAQRTAATAAYADLGACRRMGGRIEAARARPALAAERERLASETTSLIEQSARSAGIRAAKLVRIPPPPARRVGRRGYKEKPTQVFLKGVTLRRLVAMLHELTCTEVGLRAKSLRITAPRPEDTGDLWNAEVGLTYLIYDPPHHQR